MIDIVINYDIDKKEYKLYESSTKTLLLSSNLAKGLISLNEFLKSSKLITKDIFFDDTIQYHLDSSTMKAFIESNVELLKQLKSGPSGFSLSSSKFSSGKSNVPPTNKFDISSKGWDSSFGKYSSFGKKSGFGKSFSKMNAGRWKK